ncbi:SemiSWEET transporter [Flavobacterium litorale]|uniref:SemiSWEET transporter n=1 Tax=Flavobacterium litorale TaxID=2856519 RepID=A0ABX8VFD9_9FLAO|nr:SemiSWEET transporter [Flavobacterium litorale]
MSIDEVVGTLAGIFTTIAVIPQIYKAIKTRRVSDVSPFMFIILCLGVGFWTIYGFLKHDWPIIITNGISLILNSVMLVILLTQNKE